MKNLEHHIKLKPSVLKEISKLCITFDKAFLTNQITKDNFQVVAESLNTLLKQKQPKTFDSLWVEQQDGDLYKYIAKNCRTEISTIDWDLITVMLDRKFQRRWHWRKEGSNVSYENKAELDTILDKYRSKLYTLLNPLDEHDKKIQDHIFIGLVRLAQKGNILAQQQITDWFTFIVAEWIENSSHIAKWNGYADDIEKRIHGCIRCYRYTGTFTGYVYKTFQYAAIGLRPLYAYSLNDRIGKGTKTRIDYVVQEEDDSFDSIQ